MEPWLKLLIQYAIPVFNSLVELRSSNQLSKLPFKLDDKLQKAQVMLDYLGVGSQIILAKDEQTLPEKTTRSGELNANEIGEFVENVTCTIQQTGLDFQTWRFQQEKALQQQLVVYNRETLLKLAAYQRETTLQLPEVHKILENWPLRLFPSQLLESHGDRTPIPLRIFVAPPKIQFEQFGDALSSTPEIELGLAQKLREFLSRNYPLQSQVRPTEFLGGAWESKRFHSESSIKALFSMLRSEPTLILESEIDGDFLNFRMAYWGLGQETYCYETIFKLSYKEFIYESAKARALKWKVTRYKLLALGKNLEEVESKGGDNAVNLAIIEETKELQRAGIDISDLSFPYKISDKDWDNFRQFLGTCHCLIAGWIADIYYLIHYDVSPVLPELLPQLLKDVSSQKLLQVFIETTVSIYQNVFRSLLNERSYWTPELALQLAQSLTHLPDKSWAREQIDYSTKSWLQQRQLPLREGVKALEAMQSAVTTQDREYLQKLRECLADLQDKVSVIQVQQLLNTVASLNCEPALAHLSLAHTFSKLSGKVAALAISPNGQTLFSCGEDNVIKLWELLTNPSSKNSLLSTPTKTLTGHSGGVLTITLSCDGKLLASSDKSKNRSYIKIWDLPAQKLLWTLVGHKKQIYSLALSPDGQTLASGSHKIKLWNLQTGKPFRTLFGHKEWVYSLAISPDGQTLVSSSEDKTVKLWHLETGDLLRTLSGHQNGVKSIAISPDGQTIISGSADKTIKIWDFDSGKLLHTLKDHSGAVSAVAIASDSKYLISGSEDKTIKIWDLLTAEVLQTLSAHTAGVSAIAISRDGQTLVSGSEDKTIKIWRSL
ncbi:beta-propeller domain-containing protein [Lyngbya aestuarii]|uniref:beta-propeller domain-containing protein n=1 Tax=Lyngbya aestuarii TaxID=118322 RepID=UPI00403D87B7